ncbi:hypothetical protein [Clostridium sp. JN-9]|mgnify:FL=1|uniref:hypothetical protein n=1 Tax=Clostridium sp. JN-9 TaxID=2507159 RepID=UPI000FFDFE78|nr:hypothetical protein [Clostridium sp. JN-9]QAT40959.1 hypothetical protein EQM05_12190 [Clostridium sp. JN-9]
MKIMVGMFNVISLVALLLVGIKISNLVLQKFKVNRWILAFTAPMVILIPTILFKNISPWVMNILIVIFSIESIMFFEITRKVMNEKEKKFSKLKKRY